MNVIETSLNGVFSGGSAVKNLPVMQEMQVQPLGLEDPLEEEMATHSSILAWRTPQTEEPGGQQSRSQSQTLLKQLSMQLRKIIYIALL